MCRINNISHPYLILGIYLALPNMLLAEEIKIQ
jgi:hypothetical protein